MRFSRIFSFIFRFTMFEKTRMLSVCNQFFFKPAYFTELLLQSNSNTIIQIFFFDELEIGKQIKDSLSVQKSSSTEFPIEEKKELLNVLIQNL